MKKQRRKRILVQVKHKRAKCRQPQDMPPWMLFLLYLAWLRTMRPERPVTESVLRILIVAVALVLVVVALVAAGAPEVVTQVMEHWPLRP